MPANKLVRFGPTAITNSATNMINPPTLTGGTGVSGTNTASYLIVRHITIVNKTNAAATFSLFVGLTGGSAAGTEFGGSTTSIPANSSWTWGGLLRLDTADYLTALASANTTLVFQAEGEIGVAG